MKNVLWFYVQQFSRPGIATHNISQEEMMQITEGMEQTWRRVQSTWTSDMAQAILSFAERWAERMETEFGGVFNAEIALATKKEEIRVEQLTNHMYCEAVNLLVNVWAFGEPLRQWHNIVRSNGDLSLADKANMEKGVVIHS